MDLWTYSDQGIVSRSHLGEQETLHYTVPWGCGVPTFRIIGPSYAYNHRQLLMNVPGLNPASLHSMRSDEG